MTSNVVIESLLRCRLRIDLEDIPLMKKKTEKKALLYIICKIEIQVPVMIFWSVYDYNFLSSSAYLNYT